MTKIPTQTLRQIADEVRNAGRKEGEHPMTMIELAKRGRVTRPYLYALMDGEKIGSLPMAERIAKGWGRPVSVILAAFALSRRRRKSTPAGA